MVWWCRSYAGFFNNVIDIVILVNIILNDGGYNLAGDLNEDGIYDILDIKYHMKKHIQHCKSNCKEMYENDYQDIVTLFEKYGVILFQGFDTKPEKLTNITDKFT